MGNQKLTSLSFVFPMYNEIENIKPCIEGAIYIAEKLGIDFEIVVVNDASTDGCEKLAEEMAKTIPQIKVLHLLSLLLIMVVEQNYFQELYSCLESQVLKFSYMNLQPDQWPATILVPLIKN